jgi:glucokinase
MQRHVFAADLGGTKCSAAIVDRSGRIVQSRTIPVSLTSPRAPVLQIAQLAEELARGRDPRSVFRAAAVAVPGLVRREGTVWAPNLPQWERMPLGRRLKQLLGVGVAVESDRIAAMLGECWRGAARGKSDVIVLMIGTGIGAGILSEGRIIRGAHELSGCAGWMTLTGGDFANARRIGELESLVAGPAIARIARRRLRDGQKSSLARLNPAQLTARDVAAAARLGDRLALDIFSTCGEILGRAVANLASLFDPQLIVLGGGMAEVADLYLHVLRRTMRECAQPLVAKQVKVAVSQLGPAANLIGCARLAWERAGAHLRR